MRDLFVKMTVLIVALAIIAIGSVSVLCSLTGLDVLSILSAGGKLFGSLFGMD